MTSPRPPSLPPPQLFSKFVLVLPSCLRLLQAPSCAGGGGPCAPHAPRMQRPSRPPRALFAPTLPPRAHQALHGACMHAGMECWGGSEPRQLCVLRAVELAGFKSFAGSARVGDLGGGLTCIVGPNGAGKSVVGEAIAFALGANTRTLRARTLGALVNNGASGGAAATEVMLVLDVARSDGGAEPSQLLVRRRVTVGGRSDLAVRESSGGGQWEAVTQAELAQRLRPCGLHLEAIDRWDAAPCMHTSNASHDVPPRKSRLPHTGLWWRRTARQWRCATRWP